MCEDLAQVLVARFSGVAKAALSFIVASSLTKQMRSVVPQVEIVALKGLKAVLI